MGCVRETPQIKMKQQEMFKRDCADIKENSTGCVRETPRIRKRSRDGMCQRNSPPKNKASMGCVRKTPRIKMKAARDVKVKLPT